MHWRPKRKERYKRWCEENVSNQLTVVNEVILNYSNLFLIFLFSSPLHRHCDMITNRFTKRKLSDVFLTSYPFINEYLLHLSKSKFHLNVQISVTSIAYKSVTNAMFLLARSQYRTLPSRSNYFFNWMMTYLLLI